MTEGSKSNNPANVNETKKYEFTLDSFSQKLHEVVEKEIEKLTTAGTKDVSGKMYYFLNPTGRALMMKNNNIIQPPVTIEDNKKIIEMVDWLRNRTGVNSGDLVFSLACLIKADLYNERELLEIVANAISLAFIQGVLVAGADRILFDTKTNKEIVELCTDLIKKFSASTGMIQENEEEKKKAYMITSAHEGYQVWNTAEKFIKLDKDLDATIDKGRDLADEFVWEKILKERHDELTALPIEKRLEIVGQITDSIQTKRELPNAVLKNDSPVEQQLNRLGIGMQLALKIKDLLNSK